MQEITIYGAGIFGLSIAFACQTRGARVVVIDPNGVAAGASGGIVGALAPHVPENWNQKKAFQLESLLLAETFWADVEKVAGTPTGYARSGRLQPIADDHALTLARQRERTASELWPDCATWSVVQAQEFSFAPPSPTGLLIYDTLSALLHPRQACTALAKAITARGGDIVPEAPERGAVLHATGSAGLSTISTAIGQVFGNSVKGQAALLDFATPGAPQIFADSLHIIPHSDGTTAVGSTSERDFSEPDTTDEALDDLIARARQAVPALQNAPVIARWAGLRPRTKSRAPVLGVHPLYPDQFIANGGFKIGFGMAPKIAEVMADLMLNGVDHIPPDFRPEASLR